MGNTQASELAKARSKKFVSNILIVSIVMTVVGAGFASIGMIKVFAFISTGMLPGIVANITDRRPGRFASKTVMAFNLSGISPHLAAILFSGSPNETAFSIMSDPRAWLLIYGFAAFGWGIIFLIPHITHLYLEIKSTYTVKKLLHFQKSLIDEWGEDIKK